MLIDSHCHLDRLEISAQDAIAAAREKGIGCFLCVCIDMDNYPQVLALAQQFQEVYASVGVHPTEIIDHEPDVAELVAKGQSKKVIAVGETGLDFYRLEGSPDTQLQRFRNHIRAARELNKPLIVHTRQARAETIALLKEERAHDVGGVLHCFTEDWDMAVQAMDLGFYISFSGIVTFKNAVELQEIAKKIPLDRMLVETDAPYLAPVPFRGKSNQPAYVYYVAEYIAQLRGDSMETIVSQTTENFCRLFKVNNLTF
ncbi:MAG: deoxyribonuclease [Gammaproteobacteria bacterium]|jgi:TatD DNase family protein|nr:deoxyribonuclease [Gammaproteobacteria bacterium]